MRIKLFSFILSTAVLFSVFAINVSAEEPSRVLTSVENFLDPSGDIIGISSKGEWDNCPENSIPAIENAAKTNIDFVLVDVKMTLDGVLILFSDDTTERMLACDEVFSVADTEFSVLSRYYLKNACGGSNEKTTEFKIPTLEEALVAAKENDIPLILRCADSLIPAITKTLTDNIAIDMCILMTDGSKSDIETALSETEEKPYVIGSKKGNVIFNIMSYVNALSELDAPGIELKTVNRYGINYYPSLIGKYAEKMRIICDPTTPEISGYREDCETWWNDLISRGYSVIITDHAEFFCEYKERTNKAREALQELYDKYVTEHTLPDFKDQVLNDTKKAYTDAVSSAEALLSDASVSYSELNDCYASLFKAANDVNKNFSALEDGSAGTTVTLPRILLSIAAVAVVIAVQIYFFKRRKKVG